MTITDPSVPTRKRVVIADADLLFAEGIAALLIKDARWEVFAIVRSIDAVLAITQTADVGFILIDANMLLNGGEALRAQLVEQSSAPLVVALAANGRTLARVRPMQSDRLVVVSHDAPVGSWLSMFEEKDQERAPAVQGGAERAVFDTLTPAQKDVFMRMVQGETVGAIAKAVNRSPKTISSHKSAAQRVLGVSSLGGLIRYAVRNNIVSVHDTDERKAPLPIFVAPQPRGDIHAS